MARPLLCCALLAPLLATALQVWDNVLVRSRTAALERSVEELGGTHFLLDRQAVKPRCLLRNSLDELLHSVGDSSRYVEFWTREDWINLDVDVDECLQQESGFLYMLKGSTTLCPPFFRKLSSSLPALLLDGSEAGIGSTESNDADAGELSGTAAEADAAGADIVKFESFFVPELEYSFSPFFSVLCSRLPAVHCWASLF